MSYEAEATVILCIGCRSETEPFTPRATELCAYQSRRECSVVKIGHAEFRLAPQGVRLFAKIVALKKPLCGNTELRQQLAPEVLAVRGCFENQRW